MNVCLVLAVCSDSRWGVAGCTTDERRAYRRKERAETCQSIIGICRHNDIYE